MLPRRVRSISVLFFWGLSLGFLWICPFSIQKAEESPCRTQTISVSVLDEERRPVTALNKDDFRGTLKRQSIEILGSKYNMEPRRIVLLLDAFLTSAESKPGAEVMRRICEDALESSPSGFSFAVLAFPPEAHFHLGFDTSREAKLKNLSDFFKPRTLSPRHYDEPPLIGGINAALAELGSARPGDAVYALTNNVFIASRESDFQATTRALRSAHVRLFMLLMWGAPDMVLGSPESAAVLRQTRQFASDSGGFAIYAFPRPDFVWGVQSLVPGEMQEILSRGRGLLNLIGGFYQLDVRLPRSMGKPRDWHLEVVDSKGKPVHNMTLAYPRLFPCTRGGS